MTQSLREMVEEFNRVAARITEQVDQAVRPERTGSMTVATVGQLETLPEGSLVDVRDSGRWTRVAAGMQDAEGSTIPVSQFSGAIQAGIVTTRAAATISAQEQEAPAEQVNPQPVPRQARDAIPGDVIADDRETSRGYYWVVVSEPSDRALWVVDVRADQFRQVRVLNRDAFAGASYRVVSENEKPVWAGLVLGLGRDLVSVTESLRARSPLDQALVNDLFGLADTIRDEDEEWADEYLRMLAQHGLRLDEHVTNVRLVGTLRAEVVAGELGGFDDTQITTTAAWRRDVQITQTGMGCTCRAVTREMLADYVPAASADGWRFTVSH